MAGLENVLGGLLASGMGGRSSRGPAFATSSMSGGMAGGGFKQQAGLAALGYLAYKAYQNMKTSDPAAVQAPTVHGQGQAAHGTGPSLGDRLGDLISRGPAPAVEPSARLGDQKAMLLIRAMVAAANSDGVISEDERRTILSKLDAAGAGPEERRLVERELADPPSLDDVVAGVRDPETAQQVYIASEIAIGPGSHGGESYLRYLADRLRLTPQQIVDLRVA